MRYQQLIDTGRAFLAAIGPIKAAFVERAYPADFDEQLAQQIADFESATQQKERGVQKRRGGTAGVKLTMQKAKVAIDELDAILSVYYRTSNPTLYAVWKTAVRAHVPAAAPSVPVESNGLSVESGPSAGVSSTTAVALNGDAIDTTGAEPRSNGVKGGMFVG
jgi:hypothetical protein